MTEVILWQNVPKLGKRGEVVNISAGYARNYIFPKKIGSLATKEGIKQFENYKKKLVKVEVNSKKTLHDTAKKIEESSCTLEVQANEEGVLFGSISAQMIAEELNESYLIKTNFF